MRKAHTDLAARMDLELATPAPEPATPGSEAGRGIAYIPPSRQNMKRIQGYFSLRVKRQLRMLAAQSDKTEEQLVGEALNLLFQTQGLPAIAFEGKENGA